MINSIIINIFGGPGTGKSTMAAAVFVALKRKKASIELVTEYPKDLVWEGLPLTDQWDILRTQHHRIERLIGKVALVVTDSPVLLSAYYGIEDTGVIAEALDCHRKYSSLNYLLEQHPEYEEEGRTQKEHEAAEIHNGVRDLLYATHTSFKPIYDFDEGVELITTEACLAQTLR